MARILIVEDEPLIAIMLDDWLNEMGHQPVGPAACVEEALALVGQASFDAAILDVNLRGERCYPVAEILLARGVPFAFTTGDAAETIEEGFAGHPTVTKPYDFDAVQCLIRSLINCTNRGAASDTALDAG